MATRAEVLNAYATTPGAAVSPSESDINYWMNTGLGGFAPAVAQYNKTNDAALVANAVNKEPTVASTAAAARLVEAMAAGTVPWNQNAVDVWSAASGGQKLTGPSGEPIYNLPGTRGVDLQGIYLSQNPDGTTAAKGVNYETPTQSITHGLGNILATVGGALVPGVGSLLGGGLLGTVGAGALLGGTTAALQGGNILKGAVLGGAGAYAAGSLNDVISNISGVGVDKSLEGFMQIDANRLVDAGITGQQLTDTLTQSYSTAGADLINTVASNAISGALGTTTTPTGSGGVTTPTTGAATTGLDTGAVTITGTGANNLTNAGTVLGATGTGLLTNGLGANQTVNVTGKTPEQVQAEALAASLASGVNTGATTTTTPKVEVTATKNNNLITSLPIPTGTNTFTGPAVPSVTISGTKPTSTTTGPLVDPVTGMLTVAGLTALGLSTSGATSLNNTSTTADTTTGSSLTDLIAKYGPAVAGLLGGGLSTANAYNAADAAQTIYNTEAGTLGTAAKAAAPGYQFSPIGMTTAFGNATPKFDANGKLIGYDYAATPAVAAQRDALMKLSSQALPTTTNPQDLISNYISQQQGLLAPGQAQDLSRLQAQMAATGRSGLGTGAVAGTSISPALAATNPQLAAYYNSLAQQNQQIAANAPTYAQNLLNAQIATSGTLFGQAQGLETAAQQPLTMGTQLGTQITAGTTNASNAAYKAAQDAAALIAQGAGNALYAKTEANKALINQLSGSSSTSGVTGLLSGLTNLIPSFLGGGVTTVGTAGSGTGTTTGTTTGGSNIVSGLNETGYGTGSTGATTTGTTTPTLPTKLLGGGTTVVGGNGVNNASNTLAGGGGLITASQYGVNNASNTLPGGGGLITANQFGGPVAQATPKYDAAGNLIGYDYFNTGATGGGAGTNTGLLSATPAATSPTTVSDIYAAYAANPKAKAANPFGPDAAAINYWMQQGLGNFNQVVAGM